ncbi:MAG TPA: AmmeMemoRadiSam system protein A [Candidatus Thermoplasmatota archaeon]|jgi:hypothetical protein|nr:AmmeMemoRadiSam system protein A [Candidatus Thermoplasmatota archaeon]
MLPVDVGTAAVRHARAHAEAEARRSPVGRSPPPPHGLRERRGAFVTLLCDSELRGCVGYIEPDEPLHAVLARAARGAARDPRFAPLRPSELDALRVEVSVLTPPVALRAPDPELLPELVRVGDHGLIVEAGRRRGLLLPQVAVEQGFTAAQFLGATCAKAGLDPDAWRRDGLRWLAFEAEVWEELAPRGPVDRRGGPRPETQ